MTLSKLRALILGFGRSEDGSSMTEFIIFLPMWIIMFVGVINLGRVGIFSTQVQLRAQRDLWSQSIDVTSQWTSSIDHNSPRLAAVATGGKYMQVSAMANNDQGGALGNDFIEGFATGAALEIYGHWGESAEKAFIPASVAVPSSVRGKYSPEEVLGISKGRYAHLITNDTLAEQKFGSGGVIGLIASAFAASGFVQSTAAGIRYGSVFANKTETQAFIANNGMITAGAHYDVLVAPRAINGAEAELVPFGIAFFMFKSDSKYEKFENYGDENWGGGDGSDSSKIPSTDNEEKKKEEKKKQCNEQSAASGYDPDCESNDGSDGNPVVTCVAKPSWWDECH